MAERIGLISRNLAEVGHEYLIPDLVFANRSLEVLDRQTRFLEESGISTGLELAIKIIPGASLYYTDVAAMNDGPKPGFVLQGREFERKSSKFKATGKNPHTYRVIYSEVEGKETVQVGIIVTPNIKSSILELTTFEHSSNFVPDDGDDINLDRGIGTTYSHSLSLDPKNRDQMIETLFTVIEEVGMVPSEDKPKVMMYFPKRLSV